MLQRLLVSAVVVRTNPCDWYTTRSKALGYPGAFAFFVASLAFEGWYRWCASL